MHRRSLQHVLKNLQWQQSLWGHVIKMIYDHNYIIASITQKIEKQFCMLYDTCDTNAPGRLEPVQVALIDIFLSVVLCWIAFFILPLSKKHGDVAFKSKKGTDVFAVFVGGSLMWVLI